VKRFLILLFALFVQSSYGQVWTINDSAINNIDSELPNGWMIKMNDTIFTLEKIDSVWVIYTNHVNEPGKQLDYREPTDDELKNIFQKEGQKEIYKLCYKIEPRWDNIKLDKAKIYNDSLLNSINKLWDKYEIEKFYHRVKVTNGKQWDKDKFEPKTKDDSLKLEKYLGEKDQLEKLKIIIPDKCTELYSLFSIEPTCYDRFYNNGMFSDVYPKSVSNEWWKVCEIMWKYCNNKE
jgi:hypothetical protein